MKKSPQILYHFKPLLPFLRRYGIWYALGLFFNMIVDTGLIFIPQLTRRAVDIISSGEFQWREIGILAVGMVIISTFIVTAHPAALKRSYAKNFLSIYRSFHGIFIKRIKPAI